MKTPTLIFGLALCAFSAHAQEYQRPLPPSWKISVGLLIAANALDVASSQRGVELNPLLRNSAGQFDNAKGIGLKTAIFGPLILGEWLVIRHHPNWTPKFTFMNLGVAGAFEGIAIHNATVR